jgi:hypothetical protein
MSKPWCKNYHGMQKETCSVGIVFKELPGHGGKDFFDTCPCFGPSKTPCEKAVYPTPAEMEAEDKAIAEMFVNIGKAREAIVESLGGKWKRGMSGSSGAIDCPVCSGQKTLRFSRSGYNGHIHAGCSTDGCVRWME